MQRQLLTDRVLERLKKPAPGVRYEVYDDRLKGFLVRVTCGQSTGRVKKTLLLRARYPNSIHADKRKETSGIRLNPVKREIGEFGKITVDNAREIAQGWCLLISKGIDPKEEQQRQRYEAKLQRDATFGKVYTRWLKEHASKKRRAKRMERDVKLMLLPVLENRPINEITRGEIRDLVLAERAKHGKWEARAALTNAKSIFNFAVDSDSYGLEISPAHRIRPSILGEFPSRERVLDDDELIAVWKSAETLDDMWEAFFKLTLLLGQRRGMTAEMTKPEIDFKAKTWSLIADRMKMGKPFILPLPPLAFSIIEERAAKVDGNFLFARDGKRPARHFDRACAALKIEAAKLLDKPIAELTFTIHDMRRTLRTNLSKLHLADADVQERIISHSHDRGDANIKTYDLYKRLPEMRDALTKYERFILDLVNPAPLRKVLPMRKR